LLVDGGVIAYWIIPAARVVRRIAIEDASGGPNRRHTFKPTFQ
jgi:hypothetical protein